MPWTRAVDGSFSAEVPMSGHQATDDYRTGLLEEILLLVPMTVALVGWSAIAHDRLASTWEHTPGPIELAVGTAMWASSCPRSNRQWRRSDGRHWSPSPRGMVLRRTVGSGKTMLVAPGSRCGVSTASPRTASMGNKQTRTGETPRGRASYRCPHLGDPLGGKPRPAQVVASNNGAGGWEGS